MPFESEALGSEALESEALRLIERARAATGYDERLDGLAAGHRAALREARALDRHTAPRARALLYAVVDGPIPGGCHPACCQASWVRATVIETRREVIRVWSRVDAAAAEGFTPPMIEQLLQPASRAIAIAAAEMFARAPAAAAQHVDQLVRHGLAHPRWQVQLMLGRAVRSATRAGARPTWGRALVKRLRADARPAMQREGDLLARALEPAG